MSVTSNSEGGTQEVTKQVMDNGPLFETESERGEEVS